MDLELNKIYCMDCLEGMKMIPDNYVDLILTDIPYGETNRCKESGLRSLKKHDADIINFNLNNLLIEINRITKGSIYIFCGAEQISTIRKYFRSNGLITRNFVWKKTNPSPMNGEHHWLSSIENGVYAKNSGATFNEFCKGVVFEYPNGSSKRHPTEKNEDLIKYFVQVSSNINDIICDPFMGSGTTASAAIKLNRNFIGFELSQKYCDIANKRLGKLDKSYYEELPEDKKPSQQQLF